MNILSFYNFLSFLILFACFTPIFLYLIYGREPKIDYNAKYEKDLPYDDPPAIVNAICANNSGIIGTPDLNGFRATILDLIDRDYLILNEEGYSSILSKSNSLLLRVNKNKDLSNSWEFELEVLNFLKEYEENGIISMDFVLKCLEYDKGAEFFNKTFEKWKNEVKAVLLKSDNFKDALYLKGDNYLKAFGGLGIIFFGSFVFYFKYFEVSSVPYIIYISLFILMAVSLISITLPQGIAGQWTPYGREYYEKWMSFRRYIEDYSLMKDYSPESVKIWNRYLVYATALGAAKEVKKSMVLLVPENHLKKSDVYSYHDETKILEYLQKQSRHFK